MITRRRILQTVTCGVVLTAATGARAQQSPSIGASLPAKTAPGTGTGVQLSNSVLLHAGIGVEAGYDSNVFFSESALAVGSPLIRVLPYVELTNASRTGATPSGVFFDVGLSATYRQFLSSAREPDTFDPATNTVSGSGKKVSDQSAFLPSASGLLEFSSGQTLSVTLSDNFVRFEDAPYLSLSGTNIIASGPIVRYLNVGAALLRWSPGGGRLQGLLQYANTYDHFSDESNLSFANSLTHELSLDASWKWLPKTALFIRASQGIVTYTQSVGTGNPDTTKHSSYPLRVGGGLRGLITQKLSVNLIVGYSNAFYSDGSPNPVGAFGHLSAGIDIIYKPTVLTGIGLGYRHDFQNSVIGNFYYVDSLSLSLSQQIAGRVTAVLSSRYERRVFQFSMGQRTDNNLQLTAAVDYHPRPWSYVGAGYALLMNDADLPPAGVVIPLGADYLKHQVFVRLGVTY